MNFPYFVAKRYFFSKKKKNFIHIISILSVAVIAVGTASLIFTLSIFNGLENLLKSIYVTFESDLVVLPTYGKSFELEEVDVTKIKNVDGVLGVGETIEDNVLIRYKNAQKVVRMKGVDTTFVVFNKMKQSITSGKFVLTENNIGFAIIGRGIQYDLSLNLTHDLYPLQLYYPRNISPGTVSAQKMFNIQNINPGGVFALEKYYDENYIFIPLSYAERLTHYGNKRNSLDIYLSEEANIHYVKSTIAEQLGDDFTIKSSEELHSDLYKVIKIEKLFVFFIFSAIIGIASINIFFALTMLVIEKQKDISVLIAQGASHNIIRHIFLYEGCIVSFMGAGIGLVIGLIMSFLQKQYGIIGMGLESAIINSYPIEVLFWDVFYTVLIIIMIGFFMSIQPAIKSTKSFSMASLYRNK